jgi:enoyl-CoA hydratase/carnithine racemase
MADEVLYEVAEQVAVITLNRPDKRNALNAAVRQGLWDAWRRFEADGDARVAVLTGSGDKAFCAGMDLSEMAETQRGVPPVDLLPDLGRNIAVTKPTIAAVRGVAYAGGWRLVQMCDLCVAGNSARFAITEALVGRGAAWAAPLVHMIPPRVFLELMLTAKPITAQRAYEIGFVNYVVADDAVMTKAQELAQAMIAGAPLFGAAVKKMLRATAGVSVEEGLRASEAIFEPIYSSEDAQEGPRAFHEKRKPRWSGR